MWNRLTTRRHLNLIFTLTNGQCFGWWKGSVTVPTAVNASSILSSSTSSSTSTLSSSLSSSSSSSSPIIEAEPKDVVFTGVIGNCVISLREYHDHIEYYWHNPPSSSTVSTTTTVLSSTGTAHDVSSSLVITESTLSVFATATRNTATTAVPIPTSTDSSSSSTADTPSPTSPSSAGKKRKRAPVSTTTVTTTSTSTTTSPSIIPPTVPATPSLSHHRPITSLVQIEALLTDYFQLSISLEPLYHQWSQQDERMRTITHYLPGMRIIRQDPYECLFSFICSSNNNISRIGQMLERLRQQYGTYLMTIDDRRYYSWPTLDQLSAVTETELRSLGFGYRAKFITASTALLQRKGGIHYLYYLRTLPRTVVQEALCEFEGVGKKVADCVALFSLDQDTVIPVDTHVWNIACCYYDRSLVNVKSLTPAVYERVGELFRSRYQQRAGWAHSLLFAAELPNFRNYLPEDLRNEMTEFRKKEKEDKVTKQKEKKSKKEGKDTYPSQATKNDDDGEEGEEEENEAA